jgi:hypothetical protein
LFELTKRRLSLLSGVVQYVEAKRIVNHESERDMVPMHDAFPDGRRQRSRSLAVTVYLAVLIVLYSFSVSVNIAALTNPDSHRELQGQFPNAPGWFFPAVTVCAALNIVWAIALLRWKKWAFYAMLVTSGLMCGLQVMLYRMLPPHVSLDPSEVDPHQIVMVSGSTTAGAVVILFVLLIIGGPRSTWRQLD